MCKHLLSALTQTLKVECILTALEECVEELTKGMLGTESIWPMNFKSRPLCRCLNHPTHWTLLFCHSGFKLLQRRRWCSKISPAKLELWHQTTKLDWNCAISSSTPHHIRLFISVTIFHLYYQCWCEVISHVIAHSLFIFIFSVQCCTYNHCFCVQWLTR